MKLCLSFKHSMTLFCAAVMTWPMASAAAPLCREVLQSPIAMEAADAALDNLATLKLQIDNALVDGGTSALLRYTAEQFEIKKLELLLRLNLSDTELAKILRGKIATKQKLNSEKNKKEAKERAESSKWLRPWKRVRTIPTLSTLLALRESWISEKNDLAIYPWDGNDMISLISLSNGEVTKIPFGRSPGRPAILKGTDIAIVPSDEEMFSLNLVTHEITPWHEFNSWRQSFTRRDLSASISPDNSKVIHIVDVKDHPFVIVDVNDGKIVKKGHIPTVIAAREVAWVDTHTLLINGRSQSYLYDLNTGKETRLKHEFWGKPYKIWAGKAVFGRTRDQKRYRLDLHSGEVIISEEMAVNYVGIDANYIWTKDRNDHLQRFNVHDLSLVNEVNPPKLPNSALVQDLGGGKIIGGEILENHKLAIYQSEETLKPVFHFDNVYDIENLGIDSVQVLNNAKKILVQYSIGENKFLDIWELAH